ncbi:MAG: radical SAM protein [Gemmatimonadaceae bacterium]|nr:radical SAM protein [Gemmatimonadaceae bacterium]
MLSPRFRLWHMIPFAAKYAWLRVRRRPVVVHFEVTMRCNASCGFCDYWKTPAEAKATELASFADAARRFDPMLITFTGGEPLLRRDLPALVREVAQAAPLTYRTIITHGGMLTEARARELWEAGLHQINISLDYLDERHDQARGIPGLSARILALAPTLVKHGLNIRFNTVIKDDNLDDVLPLVHRAASLGVGVNLSVYTDFKNGNRAHLIRGEQLAKLDALVAGLLAFKAQRRGVLSNSDWYIRQIPRWVRGEMTEPCRSGETTVHIGPTGNVRRCPDFPEDAHWREWQGYAPINCDRCYYACRGEAQAPLEVNRLRDLIA